MKKSIFFLAVLCTALVVSCAPKGADEPVVLKGSEWVLTAFAEDSGLTVIQDDVRFKNLAQKPEINFSEDGGFYGTTGVNRLITSYTLDTGAKALKINQIATTQMMAFSEDAALLERIFTDLLLQVSSYSIKGKELTLRDSGNGALLVFVPKSAL